MFHVNVSPVVMSAIELENALQQVFMECDASMSISTPDSTISIDDEMPIFKIVKYVQDQLPTWSIDDLAEFWKCLAAVSSNDRVNLWQFKEAIKCWITKVEQIQSSQDDNNNAREKLYFMSDTDSSMKDMGINRDIVEFELRVKLRELHEENILLRDELERHETSINNLRQQCNISERQLDRYVQKCQQIEKENDEQRDQLNEAIKNGKATALTLQRCMKEQQNLLRQLEAAEIEMQAIPSLKHKVEKMNKEKMDYIKQIAKLQEKLDETVDECKQLKVTITELENINIKMRETYDQTVNNLREKNCQLSEENTELQSLSIFNRYSSEDRLSISSIPDTDGCCTHSTPYKSEKILLQDSLYAELKASGFVAECSNDLYRQELDEYDVAISTILDQLEKVIQIFGKMWSSIDDISTQFNSQNMDVGTCNIEALKHKVTLLLNMATKEITRKNTKDSSTQLRADPVNEPNDIWNQFGVTNFQNLLLTHAQPYTKTETNLHSITLYNCVNNNKDDYNDSFSKIIKAYNTNSQNRFRIIEPIIEELYGIIESTHNALIRNHSSSANLRYRSVHTLSSQSLQSSSPTAEDSRRISSFQNSRTDSPDVSFARGDFCLTRENCDEKFATESHNVSDKKNIIPNRSSEMPKVSNVLETQVDSTALTTTSEKEKTSAKVVQEAIGTSNPTSPRRKISVYCRSFDMMTMQDSFEDHQSLNISEVKQFSSNPNDSFSRIDERLDPEVVARNRHSTPRYPFSYNYRSAKNDSDSSNGSSPQKQFRDSLPEDESPIEQPVLRKVRLAPTRLKLMQKIKNELNETEACASSDFFESNVSNSLLSSIVDNGHEEDNALRSSATFIIDKCKTEIKDKILDSKSCSANENFLQECCTSARRLFPCNHTDSRKIADSENPHSQASVVQRVESEMRVERSVIGQMSNREDSLDSEYEPAVESSDQCSDEKVIDRTASVVPFTPLNDLASAKVVVPCKSVAQKSTCDKDLLNAKQGKRQRLLSARRSFSESESSDRLKCRCKHQESAPLIPRNQRKVFPSLTDIRLQESGIANLSDTDSRENLSELELQKRYIVFSLCLCTDRMTLLQRVAMSLRQRDQSEKNLSCEVQKMQQDIQELAPLCTDRESVERVERVRHQLDMIVRCAHKVSCAAETLGAVYQEHRISRAIQLADRYLQLLQSRCDKLIADIVETKRILIENNIVIEENFGELNDDLPRIRYRSGTPVNNRMMMARRRASVATMSRPIGSTQDVTKDIIRQRNSVSGRMTLRRPSFNSESPKWEIEKLDRTDSSNSINELRGIFEQVESRRSSKEENNNMLRLNYSNSQNKMNCTVDDDEIWTRTKQQTFECLADDEDVNLDVKSCTRLSISFIRNIPWRMMLWSIIIFFLGFFMNQVMVNACNGPLHGWSIEHILSRYIYKITNAAPHPM